MAKEVEGGKRVRGRAGMKNIFGFTDREEFVNWLLVIHILLCCPLERGAVNRG